MKHLLLPLALLGSIVLSSCADRPEPRPLGRVNYDPPSGNLDIYYGPSNYPGHRDSPEFQYPRYRTAAKEAGNPPLSGNSKSVNFPGGPREWYSSGIDAGKRDRLNSRPAHGNVWGYSPQTTGYSPRYERHKSSYDSKTEADFARGYNDGFSGRVN